MLFSKKNISLFFVVFLFLQSSAQLSPSTIGQVFNFAVGDSFEYTNTSGGAYDIDGSTGMYTCGSYGLMVIRSVSILGDSLNYTFTYAYQGSQSLSSGGVCDPQFGYGGGGAPPFPSYGGAWFFNPRATYSYDSVFSTHAKDSLVSYVWEGPCDSAVGCSSYVLSDSVYHYHKQTQFANNSFNSTDATFADSLGMVSMSWWEESGWSSYEEQLIWYHKAGGEQWGVPVPILISGVTNIDTEPALAKIFPNPSNGTFNVQLNTAPHDDAYFELFDAGGRALYHQKIYQQVSEIHLNGFSDGLYIWQVSENSNVTGRGKLILE